MLIGIASDHGGFALKAEIAEDLRAEGHEVFDFGAPLLNPADDYPDYVVSFPSPDRSLRAISNGASRFAAAASARALLRTKSPAFALG